ncbi:hypothetical protein [Candidatus Venteria ishoeyi]|uniref:Uncharacterized protein n=1 Tax=Candidatus Venteria ishoeyi TaxID=1899563 RepID=A0A1H6F4Z1_9GAMM|nr:hypothetical protein [Candidatus Venteria ishoeyi]SEH05162.1 Uncharacterised protein [Candidatus Venteria ishoeyi]
MDIRKITIILVIAILYSIFVFAVIEAVYPQPEYKEFCKHDYIQKPMMDRNGENNCEVINVPTTEQESCFEAEGNIEYAYDSNGCATDFSCNTCNSEYELKSDEHNRYVFYISTIFSLLAIFIGMYLPKKRNELNEWVGTGFILGGAIALLFGTATAFSALDRIIRPIVLFFELALVIFISYKMTNNLKDNKKK